MTVSDELFRVRLRIGWISEVVRAFPSAPPETEEELEDFEQRGEWCAKLIKLQFLEKKLAAVAAEGKP